MRRVGVLLLIFLTQRKRVFSALFDCFSLRLQIFTIYEFHSSGDTIRVQALHEGDLRNESMPE